MAKSYYNKTNNAITLSHKKAHVENEKDRTKLVINYSPNAW